MIALTDKERELLERLAAEGRATTLYAEDLQVANSLEADGLVFLVRDTLGQDAVSAVITPKGRRLLTDPDPPPKSKPPFGFLE
jgi:hypothetical protein